MDQIQILVIGRNPDIVQTVVRLVNNNPAWNASHALTDDAAVELFEGRQFDLVLLGGGIEPESDALLRRAFTAHNPDITIIQHYGGGSGLLATEINMAIAGEL
jgi:DNA-binding response OmpR family regulator